jgi:hypothetical protein
MKMSLRPDATSGDMGAVGEPKMEVVGYTVTCDR